VAGRRRYGVMPRAHLVAVATLLAGLSPTAPAVLTAQQRPPETPPPGETVRLATFLDDRPTVADPTAHYTLYLPASYDPQGSQPVLLIFDPRGRARMAAELFREAADRYGWILVSSNDTRSDTSWEPNEKAMAALGPEIHRLAIDPRRIYATGFSGGAMVAWVLGFRTGGLAGIIGVGGRLDPALPDDAPPFVYWGAAGSWDFNYDEMRRIDELFVRYDKAHWLEIFDGPHAWLPPALATQAVGWMELVAMRQGRAPRDATRIEEEWRRLMAGAAELEAARKVLAAFERYRQIEAAFAGLRDAAAAQAAAARLAADPALKRQRRERRHWDAAAERYARRKVPLLWRAVSTEMPTSSESPISTEVRASSDELRRALDIGRLQSAAAEEGYEAVAAKRMLHRAYTQASFYLPRQWLAEHNYRAARTVLTLALEIRDDSPFVWYNLACAEARLGDGKRAMAALEAAVEKGFDDAEYIRGDADLESLRGRDEFRRLLERLDASSGE
jgi:predicted esterase